MTSRNDQKKDAASTDKVAQEIQKEFDKETEQGFRGVEVDQTPNAAYTVAGVTSGEPTPETDAELSRKTRADLDDQAGRF